MSDSAATTSSTASQGIPAGASASPMSQVCFKSNTEQLLLLLPPEAGTASSWPDLWQQLQQRLSAGERFWQPHTDVQLVAADRLIDGRQLQAIADALSTAQLQLKRVQTSRRQTAVAAATAGYSVEQASPVSPLHTVSPSAPVLADPLYLQTTVRSGVEIRHAGTVVVLGDLNPGSSVIADGDILVWGRLRGVAHAGARGNLRCRIMALRMEPTQLRIANQVARAPEASPAQLQPEVALITPEGIRIDRATDFSRN